jgi:hypothetical protein
MVKQLSEQEFLELKNFWNCSYWVPPAGPNGLSEDFKIIPTILLVLFHFLFVVKVFK